MVVSRNNTRTYRKYDFAYKLIFGKEIISSELTCLKYFKISMKIKLVQSERLFIIYWFRTLYC